MTDGNDGKQGIGSFLRAEAAGMARVFLRAGGFTAMAASALLFLWFLYALYVAGSGTGPSPGALPAVVAFGLALFYGGCAGVAVGLFAALWRLFGGWLLLPLFVTPLLVLGAFWLASGWLSGEARDILDAILAAARSHGTRYTEASLGGLRVAHAGGGPLMLILLAIALPFILADALAILFHPTVLWQFAQFVLATGFVGSVASALAALLCLPPLLVSLVRRARRRYQT